MTLAIFDLDNTLIGGDSDYFWGEFLVERGIVDEDHYKAENERFFEDYKRGHLDMDTYIAFMVQPLQNMSVDTRAQLHSEFMSEKIEPIMLPKAAALIDKHRSAGHTLLIITATSRFITEPIAVRLGIDNLLATEAEIVDGNFTGRIVGAPCFQQGKVTRLHQWLENQEENLNGSFFYSDSINDLPLLEQVSYPHAVDPDDKLQRHAKDNKWPIISLR